MRSRRGALLLETMVALTLFVGAALAILTMLDRSAEARARVRDARQAMDLASSALARIEAGLDTPESLDGPVRAWSDHEGDPAVVHGAGDGPWELDIRTEPSAFEGLVKVTAEAIKKSVPRGGASDSDRVVASASLSQLVRLAAASAPKTLEDELTERARRSIRGGAVDDREGGTP
jgi:type II secretory pathway pseudopilin PulG